MTDDPVATKVVVQSEGRLSEIDFQDYFVGRHHDIAVSSVRFAGAESARAAPGVLEAIREADRIVICPSNPIVSIGPVLATGGIGDTLGKVRSKVTAVSPIIGGRALKGPADRMLSELGHSSSAAGVARLWAPYAATLVIDEADAGLAAAVEHEGVRPVVAPTIMSDPQRAAALAKVVLDMPGARVGR